MASETRITSESIIKDSLENQVRIEKPKQTIEDIEELRSLQLTKRKEYEQQLNKNRLNYGQWIRYAKWEIEFCHDFKRARSIYERALQVNIEHVPFWINYIKFELSNNNINHARNIMDRAIATLPRIDKFWFLYVQTEETLQNYNKVRQLFNSWMNWKPPATAWEAFIGFETRYDEKENVRSIYKKYVGHYPQGQTWVEWINFEMNNGDTQIIRNVFELSIDTLLKNDIEDKKIPTIIEKWATWELKNKEVERANEIFKLILDKTKFQFSATQYQLLLQAFTNFELKYGDSSTSSHNVLLKRKLKYISNVESNPEDIDSWFLLFDLIYGEEYSKYMEMALLEKNKPKDTSKSLIWRRYIFIWIKYALYQEYELKDIDLARQTWNNCLKVIPPTIIFGKIWILYAQFEIRNNEESVNRARKVLGRAIGSMKQPKDKIFKYYISLEKKLGEWDRIRKIYEKWFELSLISNLKALKVLLHYIEFEKELEEHERCEALFKMGLKLINNDVISNRLTPYDFLYTSFINYYKEQFEYEKARSLFEDLIKESDNVKVWIALASFESSIPNDKQLEEFNENTEDTFEFQLEDTQKNNTRSVFKRAIENYKQKGMDEELLIVLEAWKNYEEVNGDTESLLVVESKLPSLIKRNKQEDGIQKEYLEYVFPEDKPSIPNLSIFLQNAKKWASQNST